MTIQTGLYYLDSEADAAHLREAVYLVKTHPVVASCRSEPITIRRPVLLVEQH